MSLLPLTEESSEPPRVHGAMDDNALVLPEEPVVCELEALRPLLDQLVLLLL
jgi:hypothetical protein